MEDEIRYLRMKVTKLEAIIAKIQDDVHDKLSMVLERFFNHRVDQIVKQKKALELEEDICLNLLSSFTLSADESSPDRNFRGPQTSSLTPKSKKKKRRRTRMAMVDDVIPATFGKHSEFSVVADSGTDDNENDSVEFKLEHESEDSDSQDYYEPQYPGSEDPNFSVYVDGQEHNISIKTSKMQRAANDSGQDKISGNIDNPEVRSRRKFDHLNRYQTKINKMTGRSKDKIWKHFEHDGSKTATCSTCRKSVCARAYIMKTHKLVCDQRQNIQGTTVLIPEHKLPDATPVFTS